MSDTFHDGKSNIPGHHPHVMDEQVAFALGKGDMLSFYDMATWKPNTEPFRYSAFFDWGPSWGGGGLTKEGEQNAVTLWGNIKWDLFATVDLKRAYIRGRLAAYSVTITSTSIRVGYANSHKSRDQLALFIRDVVDDRFERFGSVGGSLHIVKDDGPMCYIPLCPSVTITAHPDVIAYLTT